MTLSAQFKGKTSQLAFELRTWVGFMSQIQSSPSPSNGESVSRSSARERAPWPTAIFVLGPLILFGLLAEDIYSRQNIRFDTPLLLRLHGHANTSLDAIMMFLSQVGGLPILGYTALLITFWMWKKRRARWTFLLVAMVGTCLRNIALKTAFKRARPDLWLSIAPEHDFSFPSGHSMLSSTFVLALIVLAWKSGWPLWAKCAATLVGLGFALGVISSRLYLGVHFPSDVLAGFCLSLSWVSLLSGILARRLSRAPLLRS